MSVEVRPPSLAHLSDAERARILDEAISEWRDLLDHGGEPCTTRGALDMIAALRAFYRELSPVCSELAKGRGLIARDLGQALARAHGAAANAANRERDRNRNR